MTNGGSLSSLAGSRCKLQGTRYLWREKIVIKMSAGELLVSPTNLLSRYCVANLFLGL